MCLDEAISIHEDIVSKKSLGIHWGTFKLTYEHYLAPRTEMRECVQQRGLDPTAFEVVDFGETVEGES